MRRIGILMLAVFFCFVSTTWPQAQSQWEPEIITFEAPGRGHERWPGTIAFGNDAQGAIMGLYGDANSVYHGFLRARDGTIHHD